MEMILVVGVIVGVVLGIDHYRTRQHQRLLPEARYKGRLRHLRTGELASTCSWCKNTALARKLFMFERTPRGWRAADVMQRLQTCADAEVEALARLLTADHPQWRRICTERCAGELSAFEHVEVEAVFASCAYCAVRAPASLHTCPNCGAPRKDASTMR